MKIRMEPTFIRGKKKCKKRHWDLNLLDNIIASYLSKGGFSKEETIKYADHLLKGEWKNHREFHPYGHHHDWVVVYHIEGDKIVLDATGDKKTLVLDATGSHDEVFGSDDFY